LATSTAFALPDSLHARLVGALDFAEPMSATACAAAGNYCYVGGEVASGQIYVYDVSDTANIHVAGRTRTAAGDAISAIVKSGNYLYASSWGCKLVVVNVADPAHPSQAGHLDVSDSMGFDVAVSGSYAYVAEDWGLRVVNVSSPGNPATAARLPLGWCSCVAVSGSYAYVVADNTTLVVVDIQNPTSPQQRGSFSLAGIGWGLDVALKGSFACLATSDGLEVVDVSDPDDPQEAGFLALDLTSTIEVSGNNAWLGGFDVLYMVDISNPADPETVTQTDDFGSGQQGDALSVANGLVYNSATAELRVLALTGAGPVIAGHVGSWRSFGLGFQGSLGFVAAGSDGLKVVNCANPRSPSVVGSLACTHAMDVFVRDSFAYVADESLFRVVKVKDPASPAPVGSLAMGNQVYGVYVAGDYAYLAALDSGLRVVNVSNPASPVLAGRTTAAHDAEDVFVRDTLAFVSDMAQGLRIIDVADPAHPSQIGFYDDSLGLTYCTHVLGNRAYCADDAAGLRVIDVTNPANPVKVGELDFGFELTGVWVVDSLAYVTDWNDFFVVNVADPANLHQTGSVSLEGEDLALSGEYAYVVGAGFTVVDVSNANGGLHLAGACEYPAGNSARDVEAQGSYAYLTCDSGLQVIDAGNPEQPRSVALCPGEGFDRLALTAGYAFVAQTESLIIVNVTNPLNPTRTGLYYSTDGQPHGVAVSGSLAYLCCGRPDAAIGLRVIDVSDPAHPQPCGFCNLGPAISMRSVAVRDSWAFVTADSTDHEGIFLIKVADPMSPEPLGFRWLGGNPIGLVVPDTLCYIAAGDTCGLLTYNVANPANPVRVSKFHEQGSYTEDVGFRDGYACLADNQLGLRLIDVSAPQNPGLYGYYNPGDDWYHDLFVTPRYVFVSGASRLSIIETGLSGTPEAGATGLTRLAVAPNPARRSAAIEFTLARPATVRLRLYDLTGALRLDIGSNPHPAGRALRRLDTRRLPAGIYVLRLDVGSKTSIRKLVIAR